jgi:hypothetical protein
LSEEEVSQFSVHYTHFQAQADKWSSYRQQRAEQRQQQQQQQQPAYGMASANAETYPHHQQQLQQQQYYSSTSEHSQPMQQQQQQPQTDTTAQLSPTTTATSTAPAAATATTTTSFKDTVMGSGSAVAYTNDTTTPSEKATTATAINDNVAFLREKGITSVGGAVAAVKELRSASSSATALSSSVHTSASGTSTTVGKISSSIAGTEIRGKVAAVIDSVITEAPAATVARDSSGSSSSVASKRKRRWGMTPADMLNSDTGMLPIIQPTAAGVNSSVALSELSSTTSVSDKLAVSSLWVTVDNKYTV